MALLPVQSSIGLVFHMSLSLCKSNLHKSAWLNLSAWEENSAMTQRELYKEITHTGIEPAA